MICVAFFYFYNITEIYNIIVIMKGEMIMPLSKEKLETENIEYSRSPYSIIIESTEREVATASSEKGAKNLLDVLQILYAVKLAVRKNS